MLTVDPPAIFLFSSESDREALSKAILDRQGALERQPSPAAAIAANADSSQQAKASRGSTPAAGPSRTGPHGQEAAAAAARGAAAGAGAGKKAGLPAPTIPAADGQPGPSAAAAGGSSNSRPSSAGSRPPAGPQRPAGPPMPSAQERKQFLAQIP